MHADAVDDAKLRLLAFEDRWHFVALLCLKAEGMIDADTATRDRLIAVKLGLTVREADEVKRRLCEIGLVDENWQPVAWDKRQYISDTSTDRVQKHRKTKEIRAKRETVVKRFRNVAETPPETDTESDTESEKIKSEKDLDWGGVPASALKPRFDTVKGGAKRFAGIGERPFQPKNPARADQDLVTHMTTHEGIAVEAAWLLVQAARDPASDDHTDAARQCEKISRKHKLGWFHMEAAE